MRALLTFLTAALFAFGARAAEITVAAAISLKEAMMDVAAVYRQQTGESVQLTFGSSGQLAAQVKSGAPIDLFISAAARQIDDLARVNAIDPQTRRVVAGNSLVLITTPDSLLPIDSFAKLADEKIQRIAIGEPKTVPAGQYAMHVLDSLNLTVRVQDRLVYGTNVRQVLNYVERGEVDAGIVYGTDAATAAGKVKVVAAAPVGSHDAIVYPAAVVAASSRPQEARQFLEFLATPHAQDVMKKRGFSPPPGEGRE